MLLTITLFFALLWLRLYVVKNEYIWYVCYYTLSTAWGVSVWLSVPGSLLQCIPGTIDAMVYYQMQVAFYLATFVFITCIDRSNPDNDAKMVAHHLMTLCIIFLSDLFEYQRVGLVVLVIHDFSDIWLYLSRYLRARYSSDAQITRAAFGTFVVSFAVLRLVFFPWFIFTQCVWIVTDVARSVAFAGLVGLFLLHCVWFKEIVRIVRNVFK